MPQDYNKTEQELTRLLNNQNIPKLRLNGQKFVVISDIHLGSGRGADDFVHNEEALLNALDYYRKENYTLFLAGDIEDFWQVKLKDTKLRYNFTIYQKLREFDSQKLIRIFGNHDIEWGKYSQNDSEKYIDPAFADGRGFGSAYEAAILIDENDTQKIIILHGHQGSLESQALKSISKPFVWFYGQIFEPIFRELGLLKHSSEPNTKVDSNYEKVFYSLALEKQIVVICGHSHNAIFASKCYADTLQERINQAQLKLQSPDCHNKEELLAEIEKNAAKLRNEKQKRREIKPTAPNSKPKPVYFNTGCCLYTYGITAIELTDEKIKLVKWHSESKVSELYASMPLNECWRSS